MNLKLQKQICLWFNMMLQIWCNVIFFFFIQSSWAACLHSDIFHNYHQFCGPAGFVCQDPLSRQSRSERVTLEPSVKHPAAQRTQVLDANTQTHTHICTHSKAGLWCCTHSPSLCNIPILVSILLTPHSCHCHWSLLRYSWKSCCNAKQQLM